MISREFALCRLSEPPVAASGLPAMLAPEIGTLPIDDVGIRPRRDRGLTNYNIGK
jgi:hypothetical protein